MFPKYLIKNHREDRTLNNLVKNKNLVIEKADKRESEI